MHDIPERRWTRGAGPILEWTLDGNIHYTNGGRAFRQWTLEVEGDTIDLSGFKYEYADETLRPILERRGFDVVMPEKEQDASIWQKLFG